LAQLISTTEAFEQRATAAEALAVDVRAEAERRDERAAHALHDGAMQSMVTAHRSLEAARSALAAAETDAATSHVDRAQEAVRSAMQEVRDVIATLHARDDAR
jgi:signal transduction histidine kinase